MTRRSSFPPDPVRQAAVEEAARHAAFGSLVQQIMTTAPADTIATATRPRARLHRGRRRAWLAVGVAVVATLGAVLPIVLTNGSGGLRHAITTPFEAAKSFRPSSANSGPRLRSGKWQLAGALLSGDWNQNTAGPPGGLVTCASASACYDLSGYYTSPTPQTPRYYSLYATSDLGRSWSVLPMPAGFQATTSLSCPASSTCAVGGTLNGQPVFLVSTDGGSQWTITPLTGLSGELVELACSSATACHGILGPSWAAVTAEVAQVQSSPPDEIFVTTTDAGRTWESSPLPAADLVDDFACADAGHCVVIGARSQPGAGSGQADFVRVTADGGATWASGSLPLGFTVSSFSGLSCPDAEQCFVVGSIPMGNANPPQCAKLKFGKQPTTTPAAVPMSPAVEAISKMETALAAQAAKSEAEQGSFGCSGAGQAVSDIAATSDGGLTWTPEGLPSNVPDPQLSGVSCSSATECWAAGSETVAQQVGKALDDGSPVLLGTTSGGATWSKVIFTVPAGAPNAYGQSYLSIGDIDCPAPGTCIAQGATAQSSPTAPVYSLVSP